MTAGIDPMRGWLISFCSRSCPCRSSRLRGSLHLRSLTALIELLSIPATVAARLVSSAPATASTHSPISEGATTPKARSRASAISRAVAKRCAGSRARPRMISKSSSAGSPGHQGARQLDASLERAHDDHRLVVALEEPLPDEALPEHDRRGVDVGRSRHVAAVQLLGRHVGDLALDLPLAGRLQPTGGLGDAEVEHARGAVGADEDVLRAHVAVDDRQRMPLLVPGLVRGVQPVEHAAHYRGQQARRDALVLRLRRACQARERLALHVLHHQEDLAFGGDDVERGDDVGMTDTTGEAGLVEEHRHELRVLGVLRVQPLDGHRAREPDRAREPPEVHRRHAAGGDLPVEHVATDLATGAAGRRSCLRVVRAHRLQIQRNGRLRPWPQKRLL